MIQMELVNINSIYFYYLPSLIHLIHDIIQNIYLLYFQLLLHNFIFFFHKCYLNFSYYSLFIQEKAFNLINKNHLFIDFLFQCSNHVLLLNNEILEVLHQNLAKNSIFYFDYCHYHLYS